MIPKKYTGAQLVGMTCRPLRPIRNNAGAVVTENTLCTIIAVTPGSGFTIQTEECPCCHMAVRITHVSRESLELVERDGAAGNTDCCRRCAVYPLTVEHLRDMPLHEWVWVKPLVPMEHIPSGGSYFQKFDLGHNDSELACGYPGWCIQLPYKDFGITWSAFHHQPYDKPNT